MKVKELLADPKHWTKGHLALDSKGQECYTHEPKAVRFCLSGAIRKCYPNWPEIEAKVAKELPFDFLTILSWNDAPARTHAEVLELVTRLDI